MGDSFERAVFTSDSTLPQRFYDEGMVWLANRVLHPFGWAVGIILDTESQKVTGLLLQRTLDPEGIITDEAGEIQARRRFFTAMGKRRRKVKPPDPVVAVSGPPVCLECGFEKWKVGDRTGCPNPRCPEHETMPRELSQRERDFGGLAGGREL